MRAPTAGVTVVSTMLAALPIAWAEGPVIDHAGVGCVVAGSFPRLETRLAPEDRVARARVYFRAEDAVHWYYVEMKAEAGSYWAALPKPQKTLKRFDYYIEATDKRAGHEPDGRVLASGRAGTRSSVTRAARRRLP